MGALPLREMEEQERALRPLLDLRFRRLMGREAWDALPQAVRQRFSKRLSGDAVALYRGRVVRTDFSVLGWLLAQILRIIGAPLPVSRDTDVPAVVSVSEDHRSGGQVWSRLYGRRNGFPQVIHSAKRFAGATGIEEYVGHGVGMALKVEALADGLRFISDHYFLTIAGRRLRLPRWIEPGQTVVEHHDLGHGCFRFSLMLHHPWLGRLVEQHALFRDA
ncbi:MAG TPA: DUF4166 domain-containing protein [Sphingomicrobium sp.]|jgi:hypothetical protein|nr:DUF4166 domain-containing protein [Sphingomicrobium sp.]